MLITDSFLDIVLLDNYSQRKLILQGVGGGGGGVGVRRELVC